MTQNDFSIWMVEYALVKAQASDAVYSGYARVGETVYMPFTFVVVHGQGKNILIDCGIDFHSEVKQQMATGFGVECWNSPQEALARVGLTVEDIDVIIPTHAHWDHMGSLRVFPNATVYLQRAEREGWQSLLASPREYAALMSAIDPDDIEVLTDLENEERLVLLDGEVRDLLPGIHIWTDLNGHSHASQLVLLESETSEGTDNYIAIGDVAYSLDNLTGVQEFPHFIPNTKWAIGGAYSTMQSYERILRYVGDGLHRILIEHDGKMWGRHPTVRFPDGLHVAEVRLGNGERSRLSLKSPMQEGEATSKYSK